MTKPTLLSIVIPTYEMKGQGVFFLKRCLASIENQKDIDWSAFEVVISDQSLDTKIENFCQEYKASFLLRYHRTPTGKGIAAHNLNTGIALAQGQYIKILFQDDLLVEGNYLKQLSDRIKTSAATCYLSGVTHTKNGQDFYGPLTPTQTPYFLFGNNTVSSPSVLTVQKSYLLANPFDEHLKLLFDCDFYYQLFANQQTVEVIDTITVANGVWEGQTQFAISHQQFSQEVRYLNWKYPSAQLSKVLPEYQAYFHALHPTAPFPFDTKISPSIIEKYWWKITRQNSSSGQFDLQKHQF